MARLINVTASAFVALLIGTGLGNVSRAQDCPRGDLDKAYCDRNTDLVADTPAQTVNPPTLVFAYTPVEDPALYSKVWDGFLRHLEKVTGKKVVFHTADGTVLVPFREPVVHAVDTAAKRIVIDPPEGLLDL